MTKGFRFVHEEHYCNKELFLILLNVQGSDTFFRLALKILWRTLSNLIEGYEKIYQ